MVHDEAGQVLTGALADDGIPTAADVVPVHAEVVETSPLNPLGAKGVGEGGATRVPAAVANAVVDALAPLGIRHVDPPDTSEVLWRLVTGAGGGTR